MILTIEISATDETALAKEMLKESEYGLRYDIEEATYEAVCNWMHWTDEDEDGLVVDIKDIKAAQPACSSCDSVIYPGEPQRSGDDGELLCLDCYGRLHGARDAADGPWVRGDALYDESRLRDG